MKQVKSPSDVPDGNHFAVMTYKKSSRYVEGDERSRTHPGHGYPAYCEEVFTISHYVTTSKDEFESFVIRTHAECIRDSATTYVAMTVSSKAKVDTKVTVSIT
ncbi:hypothetical protein UFOVP1290_225 [uncultured Caudovirales phage]|uniref:Uncharacterized protein n=1 Tax=uncultured Caudovirales phage TaxID=2100421 RepID=A0A6J5RWS2_9CAUD|nr:hypothetical protein UFOVP1290_225 [uncultured Caudovirales phage]